VSDSFSLLTDQSADVESPSARAMRLSAERMERVVRETQPTHIIATVSGGRDSAAQVELARELGIKIDLILHCRTGTGIPETTKHVVDYYNFSYRILKADPMRKAVSSHIRKGRRGIRTLLLNGARAAESDNRQKNLLETRMDKGNLWVNIIHDWTSDDRDRYLQERQVPINPVAIQLCRSGECMCGTMQSHGARNEAAAIYPEWGAWLDELDRRATSKHGWGWGEPMPKPVDCRQSDLFQPLCIGCARDDQRDAA
jgi:3'-phosphoadenosine 5'-phosphosulfate sulfotransferase (PAPS reductase)/FAD synthetase